MGFANTIKPAKGGRSKKTGASEAARQTEIPAPTPRQQSKPQEVPKSQAELAPAPTNTERVRFANNVVVSLSSLGTSRVVSLDWMNGAPVGVQVTSTATTGTFVYTVQLTLNDIMMTPAAAVNWINDPNATTLTSNSSGIFVYTQPLAGIRLNSSTAPPSPITMVVTQGSWL
jgi:hypothetical protein